MAPREEEDIPVYGRRLRELREHWRLSKAQLARMAGTSDATVGRIERGVQRRPSLPLYIRLADVLQCSLDWLAGRAWVSTVPPWDRSGVPPAQVQGGSLEGEVDDPS